MALTLAWTCLETIDGFLEIKKPRPLDRDGSDPRYHSAYRPRCGRSLTRTVSASIRPGSTLGSSPAAQEWLAAGRRDPRSQGVPLFAAPDAGFVSLIASSLAPSPRPQRRGESHPMPERAPVMYASVNPALSLTETKNSRPPLGRESSRGTTQFRAALAGDASAPGSPGREITVHKSPCTTGPGYLLALSPDRLRGGLHGGVGPPSHRRRLAHKPSTGPATLPLHSRCQSILRKC